MATRIKVDLTGVDINVIATIRGGRRRLNLSDENGALDLTGVASFDGEILASESATVGSGTSVSWPVVDPAGGVQLIIPPTPVGDYWVYAIATVSGEAVELSGPLTITPW